MPARFSVIKDGKLAQAVLSFARDKDVMTAKSWRISQKLKKNPVLMNRAMESRELSRLAAKRWRHYRESDTFAQDFKELRRMIARDPHGEFCFHLKVTAAWMPGTLAGAMVRRTWCHHLMIDFLFVHPDICGKLVGIRTMGLQILQSVCYLARELGCKRVWGEATHDSAPFYIRQLGREVEDYFAIEKAEISLLANRFLEPPSIA